MSCVSPEVNLSSFNKYHTAFVNMDAKLQWTLEDSPNYIQKLLSQQHCVLPSQLADSINNKSFADVTFIVGPPQHAKKYVGHRVLLAMTSPVFEAMFYSDLASDKNKFIRVSDVAPIGFENLLRYAYTDTLNLNSVHDAMLTAYGAKKYLLPQLLNECLAYVEQNICPSTACGVYEFARVLNSQHLVLHALQMIDKQTSKVISSKSFNHIQPSTLEVIASRKYMNLISEADGEFSLCAAILRWCKCELTNRRHSSSEELNFWQVARSMLIEFNVLSKIRFLAMSIEEFAQICVMSTGNDKDTLATANSEEIDKTNNKSPSLLTDEEKVAIFIRLATKQQTNNTNSLPILANTLCLLETQRQNAPEHFTVRQVALLNGGIQNVAVPIGVGASNEDLFPVLLSTGGCFRRCATSNFSCNSKSVFLVGVTVPIRLYSRRLAANDSTNAPSAKQSHRAPKFECHLKLTTRAPAFELSTNSDTNNNTSNLLLPQTGSSQLMDSVDEALRISITADKDCYVKLRRPIFIRNLNINELTLTLTPYAVDDDTLGATNNDDYIIDDEDDEQFIVSSIKQKQPQQQNNDSNDVTIKDDEGIKWTFFGSSGSANVSRNLDVQISELHYYY